MDTNNNTAENNEENNPNNETPQSILERRLAELNARKAEEAENKPDSSNSAISLFSGAIAAHEVIPPDPIVPGMSEESAAEAVTPAFQTQTLPVTPEPTEIIIEDPHLPESNTEEAFLPAPEEVASPAAVYETDIPVAPLEVEPEEVDIIQEPALANFVADSSPDINSENTAEPVAEIDADPVQNFEPAPGEELSTAGAIPALTPSSEEAISKSPEASTTAETVVSNAESSSSPINSEEAPEEEQADELHQDADYSNLSVEELREKLFTSFKTATRKNSRTIFALYKEYENKLGVERGEALQKFKAEGGAADDFEYHAGPAHQEVEKAFQQFRENRFKEQRNEEEQKGKNGRRKHELLEELRQLVESPETKSSSDKIKAIQAEWKSIGAVAQNESQQLWNSYHALLDIFYNNRSIFNELKDLDRRKNLQLKTQLCERAEALVDNPSINTALQELRHLHEEWKHVGPVPNDQRDSIWDRFIQASEKIHARKKEYITERKSKEQENLTRKIDLLARIEPFQNYHTDRINDWRDQTDEIQKLKDEWDAVGLVPKEKADEVNKRFWSSYKAFFNKKNNFFKALDDQKSQNLKQKTELCEQAEALKDSDNWDETKETLIQLQKKWKTIGRVPDKYSDKLWQRFRAACNEFFDRKQNQVQEKEAEINKLAEEKTALFNKLSSRLTTIQTDPGTSEELEEFRSSWTALDASGQARGNARLEDKFYDLLQSYAGTISTLSNDQRNSLTTELQVTRLKQSPDSANRIYQKEQSIRKEIATLENDIRTLKTNIEFFARSKNAEKLREEYQTRIDEADLRIHQLQQQLQAIRNA